MRFLTVLCLTLGLTWLHAQPADCRLASDGKAALPVVISPQASKTTRAAAAELADYLGQITGAPFEVLTADGSRGIVVGTISEFPSAPFHDELAAHGLGDSKETFALQTERDRVWLVAATDLGVPHAVYTLLDHLGCRWFLPGEKWTLIPKQRELTAQISTVIKPAFRMRNFSGTGGFGPANPVDPKLTMRDRWDAWKRHNRFGGELQFAGHAGEAFSLVAKKQLEAHPEYRAMVDGKRLPWAVGVKPCVSNPEVVKLYIDFRLAALRQLIKLNPAAPIACAVSVEPSDGGGHCECPECRKIGSVSDRAFYLANQVATAVAVEFPGKYASLYAYNEHAGVPSIPLEPNVYVTVIPYGFQRTGMSGDELIAAWGRKIPRMSLYDYWSIPDWENCLPSFDFMNKPADRIRYWHAHGVEGLSNESTFSSGAMGIAWYVSARLLWDPSTDVRAVLEDFYTRCFGNAAPPMKRMLERWSDNFMLTTHELGLSFRDLLEARKLAGTDAAILGRIDDFESYAQYLRLWYEYQEFKPGKPERAAAARKLLTYIWRTYDDTMVQTFRMYQLIANRYEKDPALAKEYNPKDPSAPGWKNVTRPSSAELASLMSDGASTYHPLDIAFHKFAGPIEPLVTKGPDGTYSPAMKFGSTADFEFEALPGMKALTLKIRVTNKPKANPDKIRAFDPDGHSIFDQSLPADGQWREIAIPLARSGRHRFNIFDQKTIFELQAPGGVPLVLRSFTSPDLSPRLYFYVPYGVKKVAIYSQGVIPIKISDADGKPVAYEGSKILTMNVPDGQAGRPWSFTSYKSYQPIRMLNVPQVFSFFPDTLMVPK